MLKGEVNCQDKLKNPSLMSTDGLNTMMIMPLFLQDLTPKPHGLQVKPSVYLREMLLSTEERLEQLAKPLKKHMCKTLFLEEDNKDFKVMPPVIIFQSFTPGKQCNATFIVRNISGGSRFLSLEDKPSQLFSVTHLSKVSTRLAPGMSLHFLVKFSPQSSRDYGHTVCFSTEKQQIQVPILAMGPRPLVNFPDFVYLKETLVKVPCSESFYVKNIGQVSAVFSIICGKPFSVTPEKCILEVGKIAMITIQFEDDVVGDSFNHMIVRFETGEEMYVELMGSSKNGKIWLDSGKIHFEDTYMGLKSQKKVTIYNDSETAIKFLWKKFETAQEDLDELNRLKEGFEFIKINESLQCNKLEYNDVINEDSHTQVYSRICSDETQLISTKDILFSDKNFEIIPMEGEVWPGGRCDVTVVFQPQTAGGHWIKAFCDVTGLDSRLSLHLSGHGLGPLIELSFYSLDIGPVFLGANQCYEIVAANKGDIPGRIEHVPTCMIFGGTLTCRPDTLCLLPFEMKSFIITFSSSRTGTFIEDVKFKISQSGEEQKVLLKGSVVNPTVSFNVTELDFGCVAVGFPKTLSIDLVNQSEVPVEFSLRVPSDGMYDPVTCWDFAQAQVKPAIVLFCREFTLRPENGVVQAKSTLPIEVTLVTNSARDLSCALVAENKNGKLSEPLSLSVRYESQVAILECRPLEVEFRFCFIDYKYEDEMTVTNVSNLPAYFVILPYTESSFNPFKYTVTTAEYFLQPGQSKSFKVTVVPLRVGRFSQDVKMLVFGQSEPTSLFTINCSTQGPNVSASAEVLNFGKLTLLESKTLSVDLTNHSPIGANFEIFAEGKHHARWSLDPTKGHLHAGESTTVSVTVTVLDPGAVSASLLVQVEHGRVINIGLFASASGCGITIEPNIFPYTDLGYLFSRRLYQFTFTLHNPGTRHHLIQFIPEKLSTRSGSSVNLFKFIPQKFDLEGGESKEIILEGQSNREFELSESYVCWGIINKRGIKQHLGSIEIKANFISPMIELSGTSLEFEINISPHNSQGQIYIRTLTLKSIANLPVTVILQLVNPFLILESEFAGSTENLLSLGPGDVAEVRIGFQPPLQRSLQSTTYRDVLNISYQEHPQKDKVLLIGKLNFPNMQFSHTSVDFGCIPLDFQDHREVLMVNMTPLPVTYSFTWDMDAVHITYFEPEKVEKITGVSLSNDLKLDPLHENRLLPMMKNKELVMNPLPLVYVEPVPVDPALFDKGHEYEEEDFTNKTDEENEMHNILFPLIQCYYSPEHPTPEFDNLQKESPSVPIISKVFDLSPTEGTLEPFQSQVLNVAFRPPPFSNIVATSVCSVLGGPTETLRLSGQSSRHFFSLSSTYINFGFRIFTEPCEEVIELSNLSHLPFTFRVWSAADPALPPEAGDVEIGQLTVEPCYGRVTARDSVSLCVRFYPGLTGEFHQQFTIQVGYLEPVTVLVTGYGVLPQVSVNQLHVARLRLPIGLGYKAVASLTARRFHHTISSHHLSSPCDDPLLADWVVISFTDKFPRAADIALAVERLIANNYFKENPQSLDRTRQNNKNFPQLVFPGYVVDLGCVIVGTTTETTVMVENRGLVPADISLSFSLTEKKLKQDGFFINFQNHISLPIGKSVPMIITVKPSPQRYSGAQESVNFTLYIQVVNGGVVPIYVKALLTVPYITIGQKKLDFGNVQCGHCCIKCIVLKNSGEVEAEWNATVVQMKRRKHCKDSEEGIPFFIKQTSASFPPKTVELLEISFIPTEERLYETVLRLEVKHNPKKMTVQLVGWGVEPGVTVDPHNVQFGAHTPYSGVHHREFTVINKCPFSVQLYFPDFDSEILEEDRVLRVLTHFYDSNKLLLPLDLYDTKLSNGLRDFYRKLKDDARVLANQSHGTTEYYTENSPTTISLISQEELSKVGPQTTRDERTSSADNDGFVVPVSDQLSLMSEDEIENHLHGIMETSAGLGGSSDPLELKGRTTPQPITVERNPNKGSLLVFHGAPGTEHVYWANRTARKLLLSVKSLDQLILEEAAGSSKLAAVRVQQAVHDGYMELAEQLDILETLSELGSGVNYDELCKRVIFLNTMSPTIRGEVMRGAGSKKPPKPNTADKRTVMPATFRDISVETFVDLIKDRMLEEVEAGLVLENLTGFFLKSVNSAVSVILKCVGHVSSLEFVSLFDTHAHHLEWKIRCQKKKDMTQKALEKEKMVLFDEMTGKQLEHLSAEDQLLFENTLVEDRQQLLRKLKAREQQANLTASPVVTLVSKSNKSDKLHKKQSGKGSNKTRDTNTTSKGKRQKGKESPNATSSPKNAKSKASSFSVKSPKLQKESRVVGGENDAVLKAQFADYQQELEKLVALLSRWNRTLGEFEGLDRLSSLFCVPKPQSRKGNKPVAKTDTNYIKNADDVGVNCHIVKFPQNPKYLWFDDLIKFRANRETFLKSKEVEKDSSEIRLPYPLTLASISKPDIRAQNTDLGCFKIVDSKYTKDNITVRMEDVVTKQVSIQERKEKTEIIESKENADSIELSSQSRTSEEEIFDKSTSNFTVQENKEDMLQHSTSSGLKGSDEFSSTLSADIEKKFTPRVNLEPGEQRSWKVLFEPKHVGIYSRALQLEVGGWRKKYKVSLSATCDMPRIDRNCRAIFKTVLETLSSSCISNNVYLLDEEQFYFGPVYATEANKNRTNDVSTTFRFVNISAVDVEISFEFLNEENADFAFGFTSKTLQIPPGKSKLLEVYACPRVAGKYTGTLVYNILDNPEPGFIQMSCVGVLCDFELTPKVVRLERVLLYRKVWCQLNLANKSYKPLGWRMTGVPLLGDQVSVSQESGIIQGLQTANVYVNFHAQRVEVATHSVQIEVYDDKFRGEPFVIEPLQIFIESVDVLVDIIFPKGKYSEIKFETVKVGEPETQIITMKNKGKYNVTFEIKFNDEIDLSFNAEKMLTFSPKSGVLPNKEKQVHVKVCCMCTHPVHIKSVPVFKVWLMDSAPLAQPVAAVPINVTINAFSSQYKVTPDSQLNFGPMLVGTTKVEPITIENTGKFEFVFSVQTLEEVEIEKCQPSQILTKGFQDKNKSDKSSKGKSTKSQSSSKGKSGKATNKIEDLPSLTAGVFSVSRSGGPVAPGSSCILNVECNAKAEGNYSQSHSNWALKINQVTGTVSLYRTKRAWSVISEGPEEENINCKFNHSSVFLEQVIVIKLMETPWNKKKGTHIILAAAAYLPSVDFDELSYIFREALPASSNNNLKDGKPHIMFSQEQNVLRFDNVCVDTEASLSLHLRNSGLVPCEVTVTSIHTTPRSAFLLQPNRFTIISHSELCFRVAFLPTQIGTFSEELRVCVVAPDQSEPQTLITALVGTAHLPRVQVTRPPGALEFPPTLVGQSSCEQLVFVNIGTIDCTVIVEVLGNKHQAFTFQISEKAFPQNADSADCAQEVVKLARGEVCGVGVRFHPKAVGSVGCEVRLYVTNNPYEDQVVVVQGVGYMQDIILDGLPIMAAQELSSVDYSPDLRTLKYDIRLGTCWVREAVRQLVVMRNQTLDRWYRFHWSELLPTLSVSPSMGHLPPETSKELIVTFQSLEPSVVLEKRELKCSLTQIFLKEETSIPFGWDNYIKTVKWMENSDASGIGTRVLCLQEEPEFEELPVSSSSLVLLVSGTADYARVVCPTETITFPATVVQQVQEHELILKNKGLVPAIFSWTQKNQSQSCLDDLGKASYGAVSVSAERPRPSHVRPCPTGLVPRDDSVLEQFRPSRDEAKFCWPVTVEPEQGEIPAMGQLTCLVRFKPKELSKFSCNLHLSVEHEEPGVEAVAVPVQGCSMLPCCHLVVPDCLPSSHADQLQLQFKVLGTGQQTHKCITVVNTTGENYTFHWTELSPERLSPFACSVPVSQLNAAKHMEVLFSFIPKEVGTYISTWQLAIPERQIQQKLQLIGVASEPSVYFLPNFIRLRTTLIGVRSEGRVQIINQEDCDFRFSVDPNSLYCGNWGQKIQVLPVRGVVPARSQIDLKLCLTPTEAGEGQFRVRLSVQLLKCPLTLDVSATCYQVQPVLVYHDNRASHHMRSDRDNFIDVGVIEPRIPQTLNFTLTNIGKPAFNYQWSWDSEALVSVSAATMTGLVGPQAKVALSVQLTALARTAFHQMRVQLLISKGPTFVLLLNGTAAQPIFRFSFSQYDFGPCFLQNSDEDYNKVNLVFTNMDESPLLLEGQFDNQPHLTVGISQTTVATRSELLIPIRFRPRACQTYSETVSFLINGSHQYTVSVSGRGVDFNLMLANPSDKLVSLEGAAVGQARRRQVAIVNRSEVCVCPVVTLEPTVPEVTLVPAGPVRLRPGQEVALTLGFCTDKVIKGIAQELCVRFQDTHQVLSVVRAGSVGVKVCLDRQFVPLGRTVLGNTATSRLLLCNSGDLAVRFQWKVTNKDFTITPVEGYSAPGSNITLTVSYSPDRVQANVSCQAVCTLSHHEELTVRLSGSCVDIPPPLMSISLSCPVRQTTATQIPVFNKFGQEVTLSASVSGKYFSVDHVASIPPYGTQLVEIKYSPMVVTTPPQLHKGVALFYLVDGSCLVYALEGTATPPAMAERLQAQLYTHTPHKLVVPVHNWLQEAQKFLVTHNLENSCGPVPRYSLVYHPYLMVSGSKTRELTLTLTCYLPDTLTFKIMLTNESTGEYMWYEVECEVQQSGPLAEICLTTTVRQPTFHDLVVQNPLDTVVSIGCDVNVPGLTAVNIPLSVDPLQQDVVRLRYLPLWPGDHPPSRLELTCEQLGVLLYTVRATAHPPPAEAPLHLSCDLGQQDSAHVRLNNLSSLQTVFECTSSHDDFIMDSQVTVAPGDCVSVRVLYQPSSLTNISAEIKASSPQAGDFLFPVIGTSFYPEPKGPYILSASSNVTVSIKNVFREAKTFVFFVDNPAFVIKESTQELRPNQVAEVTVEMAPLEGKQFPQYSETGKLSAAVTDERFCHIKWVYYLCGLLETARLSS